MTAKRGFSSSAALAMARAQQQLAAKYTDDDSDLMADAKELEKPALEAIKAGLSELPERRPTGEMRWQGN